MFESARIRLTAWYLLIIMSVSILFSIIIYNGINSELHHFEQREAVIQEREAQGLPLSWRERYRMRVDPELIKASRARLITTLGVINLAILIGSGIAGYFLAGRTLRPIKGMVDQLNRFISDASHELRTPLTSLRSEIEVGLMNKNLTLPQAKQLIKSNLEEVIRLQTLSDNLLELTRYEKTNGTMQLAPISIPDVIEQAVKSVHGQAKKKQIVIENKVHAIHIVGNENSLRELFTILFDNAIKYSDPGSTVKVVGKKHHNLAVITVADNGSGIHPKEVPHIFERFYRADKSRSKKIEGFGLGLSIAKKIVALHEGTIRVKSILNKGTTFTIRLPLHKTS